VSATGPSSVTATARAPRVLFVDDETRILDGLRRALHAHRGAWDMRFTAGGEAALESQERSPADVVVTDIRMPEMDGVALMGAFRQRWPDTVRVILSGQSDSRAGLEAARVAHQFLSKPCTPQMMAETLQRAMRATAMIPDPALRAAGGSIGTLAARPCSRAALERSLAEPNATPAAVLPVFATDIALAAKLIQLTSTAFFVRPQPFVDLETSLAHLGIDALRALVASGAFWEEGPGAPPAEWLEEHHAGAVRLAREKRARGAATRADLEYVQWLFVDLDVLALASADPARASAVADAPPDTATRGLLGAYLLGIWGVPWEVVEAVLAARPRDGGAATEPPAAREPDGMAA
jgi:DNA-binding NarL/FixJ family response regulator